MTITFHPLCGQEWERIADFPQREINVTAFILDDVPYLLTLDDSLNDILIKYDASLNTWDSISKIPLPVRQGRFGGVAFSLHGKGYVLGGVREFDSENFRDVWAYDPSTNSWERKSDFPEEISIFYEDMNVFVIGDSVYVKVGVTHDLYLYDPEADNWIPKARYPGTSSLDLTAFALNGKGYLGLGFQDIEERNPEFHVYDPVTDHWEKATDFPGVWRFGAVSFVLDEKAYVGMGATSGRSLNDFYVYDAVKNEWEEIAPCGYLASNATAFSAGGYGYVGLGNDLGDVKSEFWRFTPLTTSVKDKTKVLEINLYPNPTHDIVFVDSSIGGSKTSMAVYDAQGRLMLKEDKWSSGRVQVESFSPGLYHIQIFDQVNIYHSTFVKY